MSYKVMSRYYAKYDNFGESFVLTSNNFGKDKKFEIGEAVYISKNPMLSQDSFKWMRSWLEAYAKENDFLDVDSVMAWIDTQPMTGE